MQQASCGDALDEAWSGIAQAAHLPGLPVVPLDQKNSLDTAGCPKNDMHKLGLWPYCSVL